MAVEQEERARVLVSKLKQYAYEFEWRHGVRSLISSMTVRTPKTREHVESMVNSVMVYDLKTNEPSIRMTTPISLQHLDAIVEEIEREREVLNAIRD